MNDIFTKGVKHILVPASRYQFRLFNLRLLRYNLHKIDRYPCLIPNLMEEASSLFTLNAPYQLDPSFLKILSWMDCEFLKSLHLLIQLWVFFFLIPFSLLVCALSDFQRLSQPYIFQINSTWSDVLSFSYIAWSVNILLWIFCLCLWEILVCSIEMYLCKCPAWSEMLYIQAANPQADSGLSIYFLIPYFFFCKTFLPSTLFCQSPDGDLPSGSVKVLSPNLTSLFF